MAHQEYRKPAWGLRHLFDGRETVAVCNLLMGAPGPATLKRIPAIFRQASEALAAVSASDDDDQGGGVVFQYGPSRGYTPFLQSLARFLTEEYGPEQKVPVDPETLFLTAGATSGLWLAATVFLPTGKGVVFMECPSYFIAGSVLEGALGHRVVYVPMSEDGSGVDVDLLDSLVGREFRKRGEAKAPDKDKFWAMFYTIPTFHNPTGSVLSPEKSRRVVEIARKYDMLVFCDDVYNLVYFGARSPTRLFAYDRREDPDYRGSVISNGTFSKILGPGVRVGWMEVAPRMMEPLERSGVIQSGGSMNNVMAGIVASAMDLGLQGRHLQHLREEYRARVAAIFSVLDERLPAGFAAHRPQGGYFVWISGGRDFDSGRFSDWCLREHKVQVLASAKCGVTELMPTCNSAFRLSFAFYETERLVEGVRQLCLALSQFSEVQ